MKTKSYLIFFVVLWSIAGLETKSDAAIRYICDDVAACGEGWSGSSANTGECLSKNNPCKGLYYAVQQMDGGDTLIIGDGTYTSRFHNDGDGNTLWQGNLPPSGTAEQNTVIKAEHDGGAFFPASFLQMSNDPYHPPMQYIRFEGLKTGSHTHLGGSDHIQFLRCGFSITTNTPNNHTVFSVSGVNINASYILIEDCWAWGTGRYKFMVGTNSDHVVFRRCVARFDAANMLSTWPMAVFHAYGPNTAETEHLDYVAFQNCIAIDGDRDAFWVNTGERGPAFYSHNGPTHVYWHGCMAINNKTYGIGCGTGAGSDVNQFVAIDGTQIINDRGDRGALPWTSGTIQGVTGYRMRSSSSGWLDMAANGIYLWNHAAPGITIQNSIIGDVGGRHGISAGEHVISDYNVFFDNASNYGSVSAGSHDYASQNNTAIDPIDGTPGNGVACLKYPVRIEAGSDCKGSGAGGADRGANILYKWGRSGTYWGDPGWDTVTTETLWPWPNEDRIKSEMAAFTYTGPTVSNGEQTLSGARGFAASGTGIYGGPITLTSYIWEYLGNACPYENPGDPCHYSSKSPNPPTALRVLVE